MDDLGDLSPGDRVLAYLLATYVPDILDIESTITFEALAESLGVEPDDVLDALERVHALQEYGRRSAQTQYSA